ncbi:hypothetical protein POM88_027089 [Heracleum sosnowskyi]|uniref:hAT-like transposase RNase-H fold domain-containing protein n=1 Tax=Heracleum sosnowskyi TaxID=360622 RepID=A0AAD8I7X4_9APIA|nr:hypothetical protein POM88_027089 [Heracleum sosnowskyi]
MVMSIGAVMDPRFKMALPIFNFSTLYPKEGEAAKKLKYLRDVLAEIYQYYVAEDSKLKEINLQESDQLSSKKIESGEIGTLAGVSEFESFLLSSGTNMEPVKSELDDYLSEKVLRLGDYDDEDDAKRYTMNTGKSKMEEPFILMDVKDRARFHAKDVIKFNVVIHP